jgi:hypothetical protein
VESQILSLSKPNSPVPENPNIFTPLSIPTLFKNLNSSYSRGCGNCGKLFKTISLYTFYADPPCGKPVDKNGRFSTGCGLFKSSPQGGPLFHRFFHRFFHKKRGFFHRQNGTLYLFT